MQSITPKPRLHWLWLILLAILPSGLVIATFRFHLANHLPLTLEYAALAAPIITLVFVSILILYRQPRNRIGLIFFIIALSITFWSFSQEYARLALITQPGRYLFGMALAWYSLWGWTIYVYLFAIFLPLLYPTGRLPDQRWKPLSVAAMAHMAFVVLVTAIMPGPIDGLPNIDNPIGLPQFRGILQTAYSLLNFTILVIFALSWLSLLFRFRRSKGVERAQIKWVLFTVSLFLLYVFTNMVGQWVTGSLGTIIFSLMIVLFSLSVGIAILRHHLWDIDLIIRRTLTYGFLTTILGLLYLGSVALLQNAFTSFSHQQSPLAIVLSTLAIAVFFNPLRKWIQRTIDVRFYRRSYNSEQTLQAFASTLRSEVHLERLSNELLAVVQATMQPESVTLWISPTKEGNPYVTLRNKRDTGPSGSLVSS